MERTTTVLIVLLACLIASTAALQSCGNGVVDAGETCDPVLVTCCNSTCTGTHDLTAVQMDTTSCRRKNFAQLNPYLTDRANTYEWLFVQYPGEATPVIKTPHAQSTEVILNGNGFYRLTVKVTTAFCGVYYATEKSFTVTDCCGNGVIDAYEDCDYAIEDNGCCDTETCTFRPEGTLCPGTINDHCTQSLTCNAAGDCMSVEDKPFNLVPLQSQAVVDTACASDVRLFTFQSGFNDPLDNTPGSYYWNVNVIGQWPPQHRVINSAGTVPGPTGIVSFSVKMMGGGYFYTRLDVSDSCGLTFSLYYNVSRTCCGNLVLNTGEACDDGNTQNGDYCSSDCSQVTGECGDAIVQSNELCDYNIDRCCGPTCASILPASTLCRQSNGDCDQPEYCTGSSAVCPDDAFKPANFTCRNALGTCDSPETCSGSDARCPNQNAPFPTTVQCRDREGECDMPVFCDGISYGCPSRQYRNDTCRLPTSPCDIEEVCVFGNVDCPTDIFMSNDTVCAIDGTPCVPARCSGTDDTCVIASLPQFCSPDGQLDPIPSTLSECLNVTCSDSLCYTSVANNTCFIDGQCFTHGESSPSNPCLFCNTTASTSAWSSHIDGAPCKTLSLEGPCSALTDVCMSGVCVDQYRPSNYTCRPSNGLCDVAESCTGLSDFCPQDLFRNSSFVCHAAVDVCDIAETCTGYSPVCPDDRVHPSSKICREKQGPCDIPEVCDGVHTSCPADSFVPATEMCRPPRGVCDAGEFCTGEDPLCPEDAHFGPDFVCRQSAGDCDREETCTGTGIHCPPDEYADTSFTCRPSKGLCDREEKCTGNSIFCPIDQKYPSGTSCRPAQGPCDIDEYCPGNSNDCPPDRLRPNTFECRPSNGPCDRAELCTGTSPDCPLDRFRNSTYICRGQQGMCDLAEYCIFGNASCPADSFRPNDFVCRSSQGTCDEEEICTGYSGACPPDVKKAAGTLCRESAGPCDQEEHCNGVSPSCPVDVYAPRTTICRESNHTICDPPELCTGDSPLCPANAFTPNTIPCRYPEGVCDAIEYCDGLGECPADLYHNSSMMCYTPKRQCDIAFYCNNISVDCPYDSHATDGNLCESDGRACSTDQCQNGVCTTTSQSCSCSSNSQCTSEFSCVTGLCISGQCQSSVAPGTCFMDGQCFSANDVNPLNQCQICKPTLSQLLWIPRPAGTACSTDTPEGDCSAQDTCNNNGVCIDRQRVGHVCREAVSDCDVEEQCAQGDEYCPEDGYADSSVVCRQKDGPCDVRERCSGVSPWCPSDLFAPSGTICREAVSACDFAEQCSGTSKDCPEDVYMPRGTVCRPACYACDAEEKCSGDSPSCPEDEIRPEGWVCRPPVDECDHGEVCDGRVKTCPADIVQPAGTVCRAARDLCDEPEVCDGSSQRCPPDRFSPTTKMCRPSADMCDVAEFCTNTSAACPIDKVLPVNVTCRLSRGPCDRTEKCDGLNKACPEDTLFNVRHVCRPARNKCDVDEFCTGDSINCPLDAHRPDGYPCADYSFCNGDEVCVNGECSVSVAPRSCNRPDLCTLDTCDEASDRCLNIDLPTVGQACYSGPNGTVGVGICRAGVYDCDDVSGEVTCRGEVVPKPYEYCGNEKDDNCNGLIDENCHVGPCYSDEECEESPIDRCHIGHCNERNKCVYHLLPGFCFIDDRCYETDEYKRHNPCERCYPLVNAYDWTENNNANVSDLNVCNGGEYCKDGKVFVDPPPLDCSYLDSPCTIGLCDVSQGCYVETQPNGRSCEIPGARCSVAFECRAGACVCDGILDIDSSHTHLIIGLTIGLPLLAITTIFSCWAYFEYERTHPSLPPRIKK